jgi:ABC-type antimicrobial peptide transport system permease subunit
MEEIRWNAVALQRLEAVLLGSLAALALLLVSIGIYGLVAHSVTQRTREFGIRISLGCPVGSAIRQAAGSGILLATIGSLAGFILALFASKLLRSVIFGVPPTDLPTYAAVVSLLLLTAAIASLVPSLRIARIDPARTLREQ